MNLFFEESGDFKSGHVLSHSGESYQVELPSGKRSKVRVKDVLLQFESPAAAELLTEAHLAAEDLDLDFLWEVAGTEEFGFAELGGEYFGHAPTPSEAAGLLMKLHAAPIYFHKKGKGRYKAAPQASLQAAQAGIEKKRLQSLLQAQYVEELKAGQLPQAMQALVRQLLFKPDKNSLEYKALEAACNDLHTSAPRLMLACGGINSAKELHMSKFLLENFPKGTGFALLAVPAMPELPVADVQAFSIDDVTTTEIDDAFSLQILADGLVRIGIHIAAPGLGIRPDDAIDAIARQRMSTVYMPGDKITMLPDELVQAFTLGAGQTRPALSLYATVDTADWSVIATESRAEAVPMVSNLRLNDLDSLVTEEALATGEGEYPHKAELAVLWQWAQVLEQGRMAKRETFGLRPEQNNRVDYNFYVEDDVVSVVRRKRGAPLDKIVAELMIFANSSWGKMMHEHGVPGIYRAQGGGTGNGWAAKMQVRMVTHAAPHQGLGVDQYAWSTSPLRRYTDLVNQWQILACVQHGVTAPMAAPFKQRDASLFAIVSAFETAYAAYGDFQSNMERYWCLRWLGQENSRLVEAVVLKDEIFRLIDIPLVIRLSGTAPMARGAQVRLDLIGWDEVDLTVEARLLEVIAVPGADTLVQTEEEDEISDTEAETDVASGEQAAAESDSAQQQAAAEVASGADADKGALAE
ncbi:MAG: RNB domain-containing ribonuclease [Glaciimonas sp.]|nr:RNB domain-containing ribonuclease [Glaciimonas sp.]